MLTTMGLLTAIVVVLQAMAIAIRFGVFNITLVQIGRASCRERV